MPVYQRLELGLYLIAVNWQDEIHKINDGNGRQQVGGRTVRVNFPEVPRGGEREVMEPKIQNSYKGFVNSPYKIYAGNLGWGLTSQSLRDAFADQPGLLSAKVIYDRQRGRSRGFGFVSFESAEDAETALNAMNGVVRLTLLLILHAQLILPVFQFFDSCLFVIAQLGGGRAAFATEFG